MKKTKSKSIFTGVSLLIFIVGIVVGISALLFAGIIQKNGYPQISHAASSSIKKSTPIICPSCPLNYDTNFGNRLAGRDLTGSYLPGITTSGSNQPDFTGAIFANSDFEQARIQGGANFTNVDFSNADLFGMTSPSSNFTGVIWSNTTCPDGTNSDNDGNTCIGHGF